jgi:gag-polypeptide of LTR copia-type
MSEGKDRNSFLVCQSPAIPQVMGPANISDMSSTPSSNQTLTVPNLIADGSNWSMYSERVMNYLTLKGLKRHLQGTAHRLADLIERNGEYYRQGTLSPLNDEELEKHEKEPDEYEQKQASICKVFYRTVNKSMFIQVKNETDAAAVWKKIVSIHADRGSMFETNLLTQLQNSRYSKGDSMHEHLARMVEIKE